mmetsp:Transcript_74738/g.177820  ORF Transcript_74738/g.177820 Transcript_74738/m.177820 type:complete len:84 (+) Transcript_74738:480-731(+)
MVNQVCEPEGMQSGVSRCTSTYQYVPTLVQMVKNGSARVQVNEASILGSAPFCLMSSKKCDDAPVGATSTPRMCIVRNAITAK